MTEKDYNPEQRNAKTMEKQQKATKKATEKIVKKFERGGVEKNIAEKEEKLDRSVHEEKTEKKEESKEKKKPEKRVKKDFAVANAYSLPISTKDSMALCKFVKRKTIESAIKELEEVAKLKKPVPAKGEYSHKKGKGIMGAIYPKKAALAFVKMMKTLKGNANYNGIENPIIVEAVANMAAKPVGRFGRYQRKRTHLNFRVEELKTKEKKK